MLRAFRLSAFTSVLCLLVCRIVLTTGASALASDVTINAWNKQGDDYIPVTNGTVTGTNFVTLFFNSSAPSFNSVLRIEGPLFEAPAFGSTGGATVQIFESGPVTVT